MTQEEREEVARVLNDAADLLAPRGRWCRLDLALSDDGMQVEPTSPRACKWCAWGAIQAVAQSGHIAAQALQAASYSIDGRIGIMPFTAYRLEYWNDQMGRSKREVIALFRKAAAQVLEGGTDAD